MNREEILYLIPYVASFFLSAGVFLYSWRRRRVRGAGAYTWFVGGQTLSIFGFIMELVTPNLQFKIMWDKFQWLTEGTIIVVAFLVFAIQFTEYKLQRPIVFWFILLSIPAIFNLLVITDGLHHLIYPNPHLTTDYPFPDLTYDLGIVIDVFALYIYIAVIFGIFLLVRGSTQPYNLYRSQFTTIAIGFSIPVFLSVFALLNINIAPQRDVFPFSFAIGNLIVAWGLFRYRVFDIVPIARSTIIENMTDLVIVLDSRDRILDINPVALNAIEKKAPDVIGQSAKSVFAKWPQLVEEFATPKDKRIQIVLSAYEHKYHHEVQSTVLHNRQGEFIGRVFVSRDVTYHVELQNELQKLNNELEQRVGERTEQLEDAYDTTLEGWAKALELRDKETEGHSRRVTETTLSVARSMGFDEEQLVHIRRGSILHDIGKMGIPDDILRKNESLTDEERMIVYKHPQTAYDLLKPIEHLEKALDIPYSHHEKWNGTGYPRGLMREEIPLAARIFAVVDVWDALSSDRPYRKAWDREKITQYLVAESGKHFDPKVVDVFLKMVEKGEI
jgi:putative nucleotidyltransferase with HDIG domain